MAPPFFFLKEQETSSSLVSEIFCGRVVNSRSYSILFCANAVIMDKTQDYIDSKREIETLLTELEHGKRLVEENTKNNKAILYDIFSRLWAMNSMDPESTQKFARKHLAEYMDVDYQ